MNADPNMPVLIVDGYSTMVSIMKKLLQQIGYVNIDAASDVEEALDKVRDTRYGLIISDWHMQPMTGYDLLQRIRESEQGAEQTPILFVTGGPVQENGGTSQYAGLSGYLEKPFSAAILKQRIDSLFNTLNGRMAAPVVQEALQRDRLRS